MGLVQSCSGYHKPLHVVLLGLDSAGKSTIFYRLRWNEDLKTQPTIGFNVGMQQYEVCKQDIMNVEVYCLYIYIVLKGILACKRLSVTLIGKYKDPLSDTSTGWIAAVPNCVFAA
uniref:Uncharacterized protein n=1 Tax=Paramormyrops kingsleyae TaxID=1676925 RepID=A0A3B3SMZ3_9TELE